MQYIVLMRASHEGERDKGLENMRLRCKLRLLLLAEGTFIYRKQKMNEKGCLSALKIQAHLAFPKCG